MHRHRNTGAAIRAIVMLAASAMSLSCSAAPRTVAPGDTGSPLKLDRVVPLPDVAGRIDHLAIDPAHRRLFVAEYANGSVDEIDLDSGRVAGRIGGLHEPQGIAVLPDGKQLVVACGDGTVHFYTTTDRREIARLSLGDDADNVRLDPRNGHVIVGYGGGALAVIDPATHRVLGRTPLPGHPEGYRLIGSVAIVNVPDRGAIVKADIDSGHMIASWPTGVHRLNFPVAIDPARQSFVIGYRLPAALQIRGIDSGAILATESACGDADDLFIDGDRVYLICGAGHVDIISASRPRGGTVRVKTAAGARTGLFVPELHRLFVAAPARTDGAAIWILRTGGEGN